MRIKDKQKITKVDTDWPRADGSLLEVLRKFYNLIWMTVLQVKKSIKQSTLQYINYISIMCIKLTQLGPLPGPFYRTKSKA